MAIKSDLYLVPLRRGKDWSAERLSKVGTRNGMRCIYKVRMDGDSKRAGLYLSERRGDYFVMDVAGNKFLLDVVTNTISYEPGTAGYKYNHLKTDPDFIELIQLTLAHFGAISVKDGVYNNPAPTLVAITEEEQALIAGFGIF